MRGPARRSKAGRRAGAAQQQLGLSMPGSLDPTVLRLRVGP
jgi:hypothetical protein